MTPPPILQIHVCLGKMYLSKSKMMTRPHKKNKMCAKKNIFLLIAYT